MRTSAPWLEKVVSQINSISFDKKSYNVKETWRRLRTHFDRNADLLAVAAALAEANRAHT